MHAAKFPMHRDLTGFDFDTSPVDRKLIMMLATSAFTEDAHNAVLVGGPGTGKTHLAMAIGVAGITEFQIPVGKIYLSPMIDCFNGLVVSWSIGTRPDADLVNTMLDAAINTVAASSERPVVHSDRGGHYYRWPGWLARMADARLTRSMSRKACSPDNAACEGFFGRLKNELFDARDWLNTSINEFIAELDTYIRWYNEARIKISLGPLSPVEHRNSLGIAV